MHCHDICKSRCVGAVYAVTSILGGRGAGGAQMQTGDSVVCKRYLVVVPTYQKLVKRSAIPSWYCVSPFGSAARDFTETIVKGHVQIWGIGFGFGSGAAAGRAL